MLCHALVEWLFGFTSVQVWIFLTVLHSIHKITQLVLGILSLGFFVLGMNRFLSKGLAGSEVHWDVVLSDSRGKTVWEILIQTLRSLFSWTCLGSLQRKAPKRLPYQMRKNTSAGLFNMKDQPVSKAETRHPTEETNFCHLYPQSCCFDHYPKLMTRGENWNVDQLLIKSFAFWLWSLSLGVETHP